LVPNQLIQVLVVYERERKTAGDPASADQKLPDESPALTHAAVQACGVSRLPDIVICDGSVGRELATGSRRPA
jgi:hypothetical protein